MSESAFFVIDSGAPSAPATEDPTGEILRVEDVCADGLSILFVQYRNSPRLQALICSVLSPVQDLEDTAFAMLSVYDLAGEGDQLDKIGAVLVEPRAGRADEDYRRILRVRIRSLRSEGQAVDLQDVASLWVDQPGVVGLVEISEFWPMAVRVDVWGDDPLPDPSELLRWLRRTKAATVSLALVYRASSEGEFLLGFEGAYPEDGTTGGLSSVYSTSVGGGLAGVVA